MKTKKTIIHHISFFSLTAAAALILSGCETTQQTSSSTPATPAPSTPAPVASASQPATPLPPVRIKAGSTDGFTDKEGNVWIGEQGFEDGDTIARPDITVAGTTDSAIYQSEHYSMTKFTRAVPNGNYTVKLHFCETYDGITDAGQRVFSFKVQNNPEVKNFDVWAKSGGFQHADVETFPVTVTNGMLEIDFTPNIENPQINGIEILPAK